MCLKPVAVMDQSFTFEATPGVCRHGSLGVTPLSSLYLTPPMSQERLGAGVGRSEFDSSSPSYPFQQPDLAAAEDLVSMFYKNGFPIITQHILQFLSPEDVYSASLVCKSWKGIIDNLPVIRKKLNEHQRRKKEVGVENEVNSRSERFLMPRTALTDIQNVMTVPECTPKSQKSAAALFPNGVSHSHRPCPSCISPARILSSSVAKCIQCQFEFCQDCLKRSHYPKPCHLVSPKRPHDKKCVVGNKQTKRSRRRL